MGYCLRTVTKAHLESSIDRIAEWMFHNKLKLNPDKTEFLILASRHFHKKIVARTLNVQMDDICAADSARNLGIIMDSQMSLESHINDLRKRCYYNIRRIWNIRSCLNEEATKSLVHALVISKLDYCNAILVNLPTTILSRLQRIQNACARLIKLAPRDASITDILIELHWLPIKERCEYKVMTIVYKALHGQSPDYIASLIEQYTPSRLLRSSDKCLLIEDRYKLSFGKRAFSVAAPRLYNSLPVHIKDAKTVEHFKTKLKTLLFYRAFGV